MLGSYGIRRPADRASRRRMLPNGLLFAAALAGALVTATGAGAEIIKKEDMLRGVTTTHAQCDATPQTLWLNVDGRDFCVRYFLSTAGGEGSRPVVFLDGDQRVKLNIKTWSWLDTSEVKDFDTDDLMGIADGFSKLAKTTAIFVARIGLGGTSGNHTARHTLLELHLVNASLDALKQRYGFEGFHLAGQSGGSKLSGALLGLRRDIACAALGSAPLGPPTPVKNSDPGRTFFDPMQNLSIAAKDHLQRPFVISDKTDKTVPVAQQTGFVDKMRAAGRKVPQFFVEATDDEHHGVLRYTELVAAGCVLGKSDEEIARAVALMVKRTAEYNEMRRKEAKAKDSILAAARQSAADAAVAAGGKK
jgi:pimeloyl-ACP methyl ester carboxylesterase